ncbi:MAG TPA: iron ABC transporter permease [Alphaproteobacteria bacterium]|nr:iron ABC transporter permease [Alphaproteobacteria bacterium]
MTTQEIPAVAVRSARPLRLSPAVVVLSVVLLALIIPPTIFLVQTSVHETNADGSFGAFTLRYFGELFGNPRLFGNLVNNVIYAFGSAAVAIAIGTALAWIVERTNTPMRRYVFLLSIISLGIPSVLYTVSFLLLLGKAGPVNDLLRLAFGSGGPLVNVYSLWGMIVVEGIDFSPLAFLLLSSVFRANDASFEEASLMSGAGLWKTFKNITLRLAMPGILALLILVLIRAFESFEIPALVGRPGRVYVLTTDIYDSIHTQVPPNYGEAGAFSIILLVIVVIMLVFYNRLSRRAERFQTITGKGFRPRVMDLGKWRYATAATLGVLFAIIIGLPIAIVLYASFLPYYDGVRLASFSTMTLANYAHVWGSSSFRDSIGNTIIMGLVTASLVGPFTALCAWLAVRRVRGAAFLDQLATMPLIFPAIVMGVAFLHLFLHLPFPFYGTLASLILASSVRFLPYGMRYSYAGVLQIHKELEEASALSGARQTTTFLRVVLPLVAPAIVTCWLFVFLVSVKAVAMAILLAGPGSQVVAVTLFDLWDNGQVTELAAMGVIWAGMMTVVSVAFYMLARRYGLRVH